MRLRLGRTKRRKPRRKKSKKKRAKWRFGKQTDLFQAEQLDLFR